MFTFKFWGWKEYFPRLDCVPDFLRKGNWKFTPNKIFTLNLLWWTGKSVKAQINLNKLFSGVKYYFCVCEKFGTESGLLPKKPQPWLCPGFITKSKLKIHTEHKIKAKFTSIHCKSVKAHLNSKHNLFLMLIIIFMFMKNLEHNQSWVGRNLPKAHERVKVIFKLLF